VALVTEVCRLLRTMVAKLTKLISLTMVIVASACSDVLYHIKTLG